MVKDELKQIITQMINIEFTAMHFYRKAACRLKDENARFHFDLLAEEEREHALSFFDLLPGPNQVEFEQLERQAPDGTELVDIDDKQLASFSELKALQTALLMEREMEKVLLELAAPIDNKETREVILQNIESTRGHIMLIGQDVARLKMAEDETDQAAG